MILISRSVWGAKYRAGFGARALPCAEAFLHHTVTASPALTEAAEREAMREVESIGQSRFGAGFSYNVAIAPSGRVYEGCGISQVGSHTGGRNTKALGIVLLGDFDSKPVPPEMAAALRDLWLQAKAEGWVASSVVLQGHRDVKGTACPGQNAYALLPQVNAATPKRRNPFPKPVLGKRLYLGQNSVISTAEIKWLQWAVNWPQNGEKSTTHNKDFLKRIAALKVQFGLPNSSRVDALTIDHFHARVKR